VATELTYTLLQPNQPEKSTALIEISADRNVAVSSLASALAENTKMRIAYLTSNEELQVIARNVVTSHLFRRVRMSPDLLEQSNPTMRANAAMNVVLLGSPGVGKGTYADILSKKYKIPKISSGDLFHKAIRNQTELGKKVKGYVSRGELVPDEIVIKLVKERLRKDDCKNGFFLDGFPRAIIQAQALHKFKNIDKVLNFFASEAEIISRLSGRRTCKKCGTIFHIRNKPPKKDGICDICGGELYQRTDETSEVIRNRLRVYHEKTKPLIDYYRRKGLIAEIDANYPYEEIHKVISQCEEQLSRAHRKARLA